MGVLETIEDFKEYMSSQHILGHILLMLDYDGTLTAFASVPKEAILPEETKTILIKVAKKKTVTVAIVSGRSLNDVKEMVGIPDLTYGGDHGFEIEKPDGTLFTHKEAKKYKPCIEKLNDILKEQIDNVNIACKPLKDFEETTEDGTHLQESEEDRAEGKLLQQAKMVETNNFLQQQNENDRAGGESLLQQTEKVEANGNHLKPQAEEEENYNRSKPPVEEDEAEKAKKKGAWVEKKNFSLTVHYRNLPAPCHPMIKEIAKISIHKIGLRVRDGELAVEARLPIDWNKGKAATYILNEFYGSSWADTVSAMYVGDESTDEDAMKELQGTETAVTFRVASKPVETYANRRLPNLQSVVTMLEWIEDY